MLSYFWLVERRMESALCSWYRHRFQVYVITQAHDCVYLESPQRNCIQHKTSYGELVTTENWLPAGPIVVGVTSGASTPDRSVEDILDQVPK